jgi:hypothetical protein
MNMRISGRKIRIKFNVENSQTLVHLCVLYIIEAHIFGGKDECDRYLLLNYNY